MSTDVRELFRRGTELFGARVHTVGDDQWHLPTPCSEWDVHTLVNHLVYEMRWAVPLFEGATIAEVGDRFEGDLLGGDPKAAWDDAAKQAVAATQADGVMERLVHLSFGDVPGHEYGMQLHADLLIHGWDLARATGGDEALDPELVRACAGWFAEREEIYRGWGAIGARPELPAGADAQTELLAAFGRRA
jgi:uncharacterized protein (TIGR03086 family)